MSSGPEARMRPVLIAFDGSDQAKSAILAAGRVLGPGRQAVVLTVREPIESFDFAGIGGGTTLDPATVSAMQESAQNEATAVAEEGAELARAAGFAAEARVEVAPSAWEQIVAVADELGAEPIAIGSRGRGGLTKVLLGSVVSAVVQHSRRSVLVVHPEAAGAAGSGS